jgi:hypothetical protein
MRVEGIHTAGSCSVPRRIVCDTAVTTSVPCSLQHDASHLGFLGARRPRTFPFATRTLRVRFWRDQRLQIGYLWTRRTDAYRDLSVCETYMTKTTAELDTFRLGYGASIAECGRPKTCCLVPNSHRKYDFFFM